MGAGGSPGQRHETGHDVPLGPCARISLSWLLEHRVAVVFARKGVAAFQDGFAGGSDAGRIYGTYSRNAHEWDIGP